MAAAGEQTAGKRKNRFVVWAGGGGGGGGGLLLLGGALAATAALGVTFLLRAATKKKAAGTKGSLQETEQEQNGSRTNSGSEVRAEEGEDREGLPFLLPPPPQASPPPQEEEDSSLTYEQTQTNENPSAVSEESGADDDSATVDEGATVQTSDSVRAQGKIIKESSLIRDGHGEGEVALLPAIVNKVVVVHESKIIQVVGETPLEQTAPADGSPREGEEEEEEEEEKEVEGSNVADGAEESSGKAGDPSMAEAEPPVVVRTGKAMEPSLPSLEVIQTTKTVVTAMKEAAFRGTGQKRGVEEAKAPWKEQNRMMVEMREKGVMDRLAVEMTEKGFSRNAQVLILVSTVFLTTLVAILLHHYGSRFLESSPHV